MDWSESPTTVEIGRARHRVGAAVSQCLRCVGADQFTHQLVLGVVGIVHEVWRNLAVVVRVQRLLEQEDRCSQSGRQRSGELAARQTLRVDSVNLQMVFSYGLSLATRAYASALTSSFFQRGIRLPTALAVSFLVSG